VAPYYGRIRRDDPDALQRGFGAKRKALAPLIEEGRRLAAGITQDATDRAESNAKLLGPTPAKSARRETSRREADSARATLHKAASMF
jgi:hypothetical protein